jgi:hypothetical protein
MPVLLAARVKSAEMIGSSAGSSGTVATVFRLQLDTPSAHPLDITLDITIEAGAGTVQAGTVQAGTVQAPAAWALLCSMLPAEQLWANGSKGTAEWVQDHDGDRSNRRSNRRSNQPALSNIEAMPTRLQLLPDEGMRLLALRITRPASTGFMRVWLDGIWNGQQEEEEE